MEQNLEKVRKHARDLRTQEPRDPEAKLAGYPLAARCIDKCRATILGWQGDFIYGCPMDQQFLQQAGIDSAELKHFVATGASDDEVEAWIAEHAHARA